MKKILSILSLIIMLTIPTFANATTVVLGWALSTDSTTTGQKVYYEQGTIVPAVGTTPASVTCPAASPTAPYTGTTATQGAAGFAVANGTGATVSGLLSTDAWCFYVTNVNAQSMESAPSNIVYVFSFPVGVTGVVIKTITQ
jgi:hypothetical protein